MSLPSAAQQSPALFALRVPTAGAAGGGSHGCCLPASSAAQPHWELESTLGTGAANYPLAPVPKACVASGPPCLPWAIGQKRAMQKGCHGVWDDLVIIITNTAIIFINLLLVLQSEHRLVCLGITHLKVIMKLC